MAIDKTLIHFKTEENFQKQKEANNIKDTSIVFIKDSKKIHTHDETYKTVTWGKLGKKRPEYVDLGLPSGLLWATCNIGANSPEEAGLYFHWAGTKGITAKQATTDDYYKTWSTWENTPYSEGTETSSSNSKLTKYCNTPLFGNEGFTDDLEVLEPMDDAATQILGDGWRIPTSTEITELLDNTTNSWVIDYKGTGVNGRLFKGKDSYSNRELFVPACGSVISGGLNTVGSLCFLWSSSLKTSYPTNGQVLYAFDQRSYLSDTSRFSGLPIRGVLDNK